MHEILRADLLHIFLHASQDDLYILARALEPGVEYAHDAFPGISLRVPMWAKAAQLSEPIAVALEPNPLGAIAQDGAIVLLPMVRGPSDFKAVSGALTLTFSIEQQEGYQVGIYRAKDTQHGDWEGPWTLVEGCIPTAEDSTVMCSVLSFSYLALGLLPTSQQNGKGIADITTPKAVCAQIRPAYWFHKTPLPGPIFANMSDDVYFVAYRDARMTSSSEVERTRDMGVELSGGVSGMANILARANKGVRKTDTTCLAPGPWEKTVLPRDGDKFFHKQAHLPAVDYVLYVEPDSSTDVLIYDTGVLQAGSMLVVYPGAFSDPFNSKPRRVQVGSGDRLAAVMPNEAGSDASTAAPPVLYFYPQMQLVDTTAVSLSTPFPALQPQQGLLAPAQNHSSVKQLPMGPSR